MKLMEPAREVIRISVEQVVGEQLPGLELERRPPVVARAHPGRLDRRPRARVEPARQLVELGVVPCRPVARLAAGARDDVVLSFGAARPGGERRRLGRVRGRRRDRQPGAAEDGSARTLGRGGDVDEPARPRSRVPYVLYPYVSGTYAISSVAVIRPSASGGSQSSA